MNRIIKYSKNKKGITIVWGALLLAVLLMFGGMAIDLAYMYYTKNQLQVAADSAALAGAANLYDKNGFPTFDLAKNTAKDFALKNSAAGSPVVLALDGTDSLSDSNDITVGNWDPTLTPRYLAGTSRTPVNAIEVMARRTANSPGGPVGVFIGRIFKIIGVNWSLMNARASAIACKPPRASSYFSVCTDACTGCTYPSGTCTLTPPRQITKGPCIAGSCDSNACWTSLLSQATGPGISLNDLLCTTTPYVDVCAHNIYTTMGEVTITQRNLAADMYDPTFDPGDKVIVSGTVQSWTVIIPVTNSCPCGTGGGWDPHSAYGYARIRIIAVCATPGAGSPCRPFSAPSGTCGTPGTCGPYGPYCPQTIVIDQIQCISCSDPSLMIGLKPVLVK